MKMLRRGLNKGSPALRRVGTRSASADPTAALVATAKTYPNFYPDSATETANIQTWFDADLKTKKTVDTTVKEWNTKLAGFADRLGLPELDAAAISKAKGAVVIEQTEQSIGERISEAEKLLKQITGGMPDPTSTAEHNLQFVAAAEREGSASEFIARLQDERDTTTDLPITDADFRALLDVKMRAAPEYIWAAAERTADQDKVATTFFADVKSSLQSMLAANLTEGAKGLSKEQEAEATALAAEADKYFKGRAGHWDAYENGVNEVFNPMDMSHYGFNKYAKAIFRSALWKGTQKVGDIETQLNRLQETLNSSVDNDPGLIRKMYEDDPSLPRDPSLCPVAFNPLFLMDLLSSIRAEIDNATADKAVREYLGGGLATAMKGQMEQLKKDTSKGYTTLENKPDYIEYEKRLLMSEGEVAQKGLDELDAALAEMSAPAETVESVVGRVVRKKLWITEGDAREAKVAGLVTKVVDFGKGKGTLDDLQKAFDGIGTSGLKSEPSEQDDLLLFCRYVSTREGNPELLSFANVMDELRDRSNEGKIAKVRLVTSFSEAEGFDPLITNLLGCLCEDNATSMIRKIVTDFQAIAQSYRGEIYGELVTAEEIPEAEYKSILDVLQGKNPTKNFFFQKKVDPSILGGFVIKAGVQTMDFSLLQEAEEFRREAKL